MQNQNSGGWRYGNGSNDFLYKNEGIDNELLKRAAELSGAPKGLLDQAVQVNPLDVLMQQDKSYGSGGSGNGQSGSSGTVSGETGIGVGSMSNARDKAAGMAGLGAFAKSPGLLGGVMGVLAANNVIGQTNQSVLGHVNSTHDPIAALNAIQGWTNVDQGYLSDGFGAGGGFGSFGGGFNDSVTSGGDFGGSYGGGFGTGNEGAGFSDGISGGSFGDGGYGGGFGDSGGFGGGDSSSDGAGGYGGSDNGYYKGGKVTRDRLSGPNPKGPDDGYAALQDGEYVIKASSVKKYGKGLLADINSGKYKA